MPHDNKSSLVDSTIAAIRRDILTGQWKPGERLPLVPLAKRYETSTTVVRESLMQMSSDFLVINEAKQGFSVPYLSLPELSDLNRVRCHSEELALRLSLERGDLMWESTVVAAQHRLKHTERFGPGDQRGISDTWLEGAKEFHRLLISAAGIPVLEKLADALEDATSLYRLWSNTMPDHETQYLVDEHDPIVEAVIARDADTAVRLLAEHYNSSVDLILQAGLRPEAIDPTKSKSGD
ncbi:GntR family transcriptional regulator [Glutamicibacter uratoxydans]|uniref:GntR family transcriptional regulator n=1 Tax=Glutamicibacter uratoxydans TaxID=43667 RepID=UPI003D701303